MYMYNAVQFRY